MKYEFLKTKIRNLWLLKFNGFELYVLHHMVDLKSQTKKTSKIKSRVHNSSINYYLILCSKIHENE